MTKERVRFVGSDGRVRDFYARASGGSSKPKSRCGPSGCGTMMQFRKGRAIPASRYSLPSPKAGDVFELPDRKGLYVLGRDGLLRAVRLVDYR